MKIHIKCRKPKVSSYIKTEVIAMLVLIKYRILCLMLGTFRQQRAPVIIVLYERSYEICVVHQNACQMPQTTCI